MLRTLLESGAGGTEPRASWTTASVLAHAALIAAAVGATMVDGIREQRTHNPETPIYVAPAPAPAPAPNEPNPDRAIVSLPREGLRIAQSVFPTLETLPLDAHRISVADLFDRPGGVNSTAGDTVARGGVFTAGLVDRTVVPRDNPPPEYPRTLRESSVEGEVLVRFVVDSTGRVERESIVVLEAPHHLFGDAVRRWLPRTRYRPAEIGGRAVRQLVEQRIAFALRQ